ncbi:MAG: hypothetical protein ACXW1Y_07400 [Acidimicrobiia bacterium]
MTDHDLDFSGFRAERKVDVPPPPKPNTTPPPAQPKSAGKKGKKGKKGKVGAQETPPADTSPEPPVSQPEPPPAHGPATSAKASGRSKSGRKKRVNVSLPVELSQRFTDRASEEDRYLTDMVLDAYRDHYAGIRDRYIAEQQDLDLPFRPRRRKAASGRVTHMLYLAAPEIAVIDGSAVETGMSRSELVAQLLELELE